MDEFTCVKCGQAIVRKGWFWVLPSEVAQRTATFCPAGGVHDPGDDYEPWDEP